MSSGIQGASTRTNRRTPREGHREERGGRSDKAHCEVRRIEHRQETGKREQRTCRIAKRRQKGSEGIEAQAEMITVHC
jgi:hypothetical protein